MTMKTRNPMNGAIRTASTMIESHDFFVPTGLVHSMTRALELCEPSVFLTWTTAAMRGVLAEGEKVAARRLFAAGLIMRTVVAPIRSRRSGRPPRHGHSNPWPGDAYADLWDGRLPARRPLSCGPRIGAVSLWPIVLHLEERSQRRETYLLGVRLDGCPRSSLQGPLARSVYLATGVDQASDVPMNTKMNPLRKYKLVPVNAIILFRHRALSQLIRDKLRPAAHARGP